MNPSPPILEFGTAERTNAETLIDLALAEDLGAAGDLTSLATIPADAVATASIVARREGVLAGLPIGEMLAARFAVAFDARVHDGGRLAPEMEVATLRGLTRAILAMERTSLNFIQRLSGVATLTDRFVTAVAGTKAQILDTRKTTPGWRALEKYAVRCGGGRNYRIGLYDAVLIKDNHLAGLGAKTDPIGRAITAARAAVPKGTIVEIEVDSLEQFDRALECAPDIILVDNLGASALEEAVRRRDAHGSRILLEASGGVNLETVAALARTGVDRISVGALTHSAPALDLALDFQPTSTS